MQNTLLALAVYFVGYGASYGIIWINCKVEQEKFTYDYKRNAIFYSFLSWIMVLILFVVIGIDVINERKK